MTKRVEATGKTIDEAIAAALEMLGGVDRDMVSVEVLEKPKSGFLGLGGTPAKVAVSMEEAEGATSVEDFLSALLQKMGATAEVESTVTPEGNISIEISGENMGILIGRRGETLDAIQHLTNYAVNRGSDKRCHISVDAESYRAKREESLVHLAEKMAAKVVKYKRSMALEPMNSYERHVIHTALQNFEGVSTSSTGTEPNRRVVVSYERPNKQDDTRPKSREWS